MSKVLLVLPPLIFLTLVVLFYNSMSRGDSAEIPSALVGRPAPNLPGTTLPGYISVNAADLKNGQVTLVNFWASWCPPCRAEHPTLHELAEKGIPIIGVNMKDSEEDALSYLKKEGSPFRAIATDPKGRNRLEWGVIAPPETFILRADGTIAFRFIGPLVGSDYEQRFLPALKAARD